MDVKRYRHEWRMRWTTSAEEATAIREETVVPEELCARCDDGGMWITVPDIRSMPKPKLIYSCPRCHMMTAHADFPVTLRSVGD
jgi:hypothetical protein